VKSKYNGQPPVEELEGKRKNRIIENILTGKLPFLMLNEVQYTNNNHTNGVENIAGRGFQYCNSQLGWVIWSGLAIDYIMSCKFAPA